MRTATVIAGALLCALALATAAAGAQDKVLRVGIITDMSGQYKDGNGPGSVIAAQMAAEEIGGTVAGRKIEIISGDHQNKPDIASSIVREWIDNQHVDLIAEGVNSAVALAIMNVTAERNKPFLISGPAPPTSPARIVRRPAFTGLTTPTPPRTPPPRRSSSAAENPGSF
jgi:branched-chain amino acid transport system substrate-binding protein